MTVVRQPMNLNPANFSNPVEAKVIKRFDDTPVENVAAEVGVTKEQYVADQNQHAISFEKPAQTLDFGGADGVAQPTQEPGQTASVDGQTAPAELTPEQKRQERREEFKKAANAERRALEMQKKAQAQMDQLKQFQTFMEMAKKDPTAVAKALNMDPTEFLRQYQNQMFNIPNEPEKPKLSESEELRQRLNRYEEERRKEKEEMSRLQSQAIRQDYITSKILPVITGDQDKFELLNLNGREACAGFIYDMMDAHFRSTGEELNAQDVAEEMENQLAREFEEKISQTRKLKKFAKHFREDTDAPGQNVTLPEQLGEGELVKRTAAMDNQATVVSTGQLGSASDTSLNTKPTQGPTQSKPIVPATVRNNPILENQAAQINAYQRQVTWESKRENRLNRMANVLNTVKK